MANFRDLKFNDRTFRSFGFYLLKDMPTISFAEADIQTVLVKGAVNGEVINDYGTVKNIEKTFSFKTLPTKIPYPDNEDKFKKVFLDWLYTNRNDYGKLYDSERKGYFCEALIKSVGELKRKYKGCYEFSITFSCKPYLYRESGQEPLVYELVTPQSEIIMNLYNPEIYKAYPYIKVEKTSYTAQTVDNGFQLIFNNERTFEVEQMSSSVLTLEIDSELKNTFYGAIPRNQYLTLPSDLEYPVLESGENSVKLKATQPNGSFRITIIPRWRCL